MNKDKNQISLVFETDEKYDELEFINDIKDFVKKYPVKIVGTHIKLLRGGIKKGNGQSFQNNYIN